MCRRCSECRKTLKPKPSARTTQRVCSEACRAARDRKLARGRRRVDLVDARADERERQRACRARRRAAGGCHAPPSTPKSSLSRGQIRLIVDRALGRSRRSLERDLRAIVGRFAVDLGAARAAVTHEPALASAQDGE
jgi:hypothetical protein